MQSFEHTVKDDHDLHARPAAELCQLCKKFKSKVTIQWRGYPVNVTQIMMVLAMGVCGGAEVKFAAEGPDEVQAIEAVKEFAERKL